MQLPAEFHFLRPAWLMALVLLVPLVWVGLRSHRSGGAWRKVCDAHLLEHLLTDTGGRARHWPLALMAVAWSATCLGLAGPAWERLPQPAFRSPEQRVLVLNLSASMNARDVEPSRIARARYELGDALDEVGDGQVGLVIFADEPYVVAPISDDPRVVAEFVPVLDTNLMPGSGARVDRAISEAQALLEQSGARRGGIVLLTDSAGDRPDLAEKAAAAAAAAGYDVSVLAIGTEAGAPVPLRRGFARDAAGQVQLAKLDVAALTAIARAGDGRFERVQADDSDVEAVMAIGATVMDPSAEFEASGRAADVWHDMGIAFVWVVLLLAPLAFRRGWAGALALAVFAGAGLLSAAPAHADIGDWFQRPDQRGADAFEAGRHAEAAERFEDPAWRSAALYRAERYDEAAALLGEADDATSQYNLGNSLARAGQLEAAVAAYDRALERSAEHEDAEFNRKLVQQLLEEQQQRQEQQQQQSSDSSQDDASQDRESKADDASDDEKSDPSSAAGQSGERSDGTEQATADDAQAPESADDAAAEGESPEASGSKSAESDPAEGDDANDAREAAEHAGEPATAGEPGDAHAGPSSDMANQPLSEREQAIEQWLGRVSADPGGLLREKLRRKYAEKRYRDAIRGSRR